MGVVLDLNSAAAILASFHHWALKVENRGDKRGHSCTIHHGGMRVTKFATLPVDAVKKAIHEMNKKIAAGSEPELRLVGGAG